MVSAAIQPLASDLSELEARALVTQISGQLVSVWEDVKRAYLGRAWLALGYPSWDELCAVEFGTAQIRLPREERREVVASLSEAGMSTRAIAAATGSHQETVVNDLGHVTGIRSRANANVVIGLDGKQYAQPEPEVVDAEVVEEQALPPITAEQIAELREAEVRPIPPQQEPQRRRRPIADQANDVGWEIRKAAERVARVLADDRFGKNEEQVQLTLRPHLLFVAETVAAALDKLVD